MEIYATARRKSIFKRCWTLNNWHRCWISFNVDGRFDTCDAVFEWEESIAWIWNGILSLLVDSNMFEFVNEHDRMCQSMNVHRPITLKSTLLQVNPDIQTQIWQKTERIQTGRTKRECCRNEWRAAYRLRGRTGQISGKTFKQAQHDFPTSCWCGRCGQFPQKRRWNGHCMALVRVHLGFLHANRLCDAGSR